MGGRKPRATELKLLNGNAGKRRLPSPEHRLRPTKRDRIPSPPSWVCSEGKKFWRELAPDLHRLGILTVLDEGTLAVTCNAYGQAARAQARVDRLERKRPKTLEDEERAQNQTARAMMYLESGHERGLRFEPVLADVALEYFWHLKPSKGEWAGATFELQPWQQFQIAVVFGWIEVYSKLSRFRTWYWEIPRKNGKSTMAAGVGLFLLDGDGEPGAEVYSAATKRDQAKITWL